MKTPRMMALAVLLFGSSFALHVARAQQPGTRVRHLSLRYLLKLRRNM